MRRRGRARRREVVDHHANRLLAQKGVEVQASLAGDVGHRPVLEVHDAAANSKTKRKNKQQIKDVCLKMSKGCVLQDVSSAKRKHKKQDQS